MKTRIFLILLFAFFILSLWLGRISSGLGRWPERVDVSFAISLTSLAAGSLMAVVSLFALLQRGLKGESLEQNLILLVALLGGLLIYQMNWGVALALGLIGTATVITQRWGGPKGPKS